MCSFCKIGFTNADCIEHSDKHSHPRRHCDAHIAVNAYAHSLK
jgi:hypothetical protein